MVVALHLLLTLSAGLLPAASGQYVDDGYFNPGSVKPDHFMTPEEVDKDNFLMDMLTRRRLEDSYTEDPEGGAASDTDCSLNGPPEGKYCCKKCPESLDYCRELGGKLIEDKYGMLKQDVGVDDSCYNLERRAERLDVFGRTKTFRDTEECRRMVWDYTCLWWGSDNAVYTNNCREKEEMIDGSIVKAAPLPCLSYCTQVANMCANRPDWIKLCKNDLPCPDDPEYSGECTEGPTPPGSAVSGDACSTYDVVSFYSSGWRAEGGRGGVLGVLLLAASLAFS